MIGVVSLFLETCLHMFASWPGLQCVFSVADWTQSHNTRACVRVHGDPLMIWGRRLPLIAALVMTTAPRQVFQVLPITVLGKWWKTKNKKQTKLNKNYLTCHNRLSDRPLWRGILFSSFIYTHTHAHTLTTRDIFPVLPSKELPVYEAQ